MRKNMMYFNLKNKMIHLTAMFLLLIMNQTFLGQEPDIPITQLPDYPITQISNYLPTKGESGTWQATGSPEQAIGEDLFILINGGAEIYHEYGFKQVIMQSYENDNGKSINLEIYEMENSASAFGIYSFKTSTRGKEMPFGDKALFEDYYLNFWKGNFLVTITGFDSDPETIDGLMTIARAVDTKIKESGEQPRLINFLPIENLNIAGIKYLKGNLALFNNYEFGAGNIFGLREGVIGDYDKYRLFIFKYDDANESKQWFESAKSNIKFDARFDSYDLSLSSEYAVFGRKEDRIFMKLNKNFIIIVVGRGTTEGNKIIEQMQSRLKTLLEE